MFLKDNLNINDKTRVSMEVLSDTLLKQKIMSNFTDTMILNVLYNNLPLRFKQSLNDHLVIK